MMTNEAVTSDTGIVGQVERNGIVRGILRKLANDPRVSNALYDNGSSEESDEELRGIVSERTSDPKVQEEVLGRLGLHAELRDGSVYERAQKCPEQEESR